MSRSRLVIAGVIATALVVVLLRVFLSTGQEAERPPSKPELETATSINLGVTYLPMTPGVSAYYDLGVDSGALVTEVVSGSPADRAGVQVGDVILSFNGAILEEEASLLGMMMACPAGNRITLEVWREKSRRIIEFIHTRQG